MKKILRYLAIAIGTVSTLIVTAFTVFYFVGEHDLASKGATCMASEDFVAVRSKLNDALAKGIIDTAVMDRENTGIEQAKEYCVDGQMKESKAMLMKVMFDASIQSDSVYERKVNEGQKDDDKGDHKSP